MDNNEYISKLRAALEKAGVSEPEEILDEYRAYFKRKENDGFSCDDAAAKLENPELIARQYSPEYRRRSKGPSFLLIIGIVLAGIFALCFFLFIFAWAVVFAALAAGFAITGICYIFGARVTSVMPYVPMFEAIFMGVAFIALTVLAAIMAIYCWLYAVHLLKVYIRWNKNVFANKYSPPSPKHPQLSAKLTRKLRDTSLFSATIFASFFAAAVVLLCIHTRSVFFWNSLGWFR